MCIKEVNKMAFEVLAMGYAAKCGGKGSKGGDRKGGKGGCK